MREIVRFVWDNWSLMWDGLLMGNEVEKWCWWGIRDKIFYGLKQRLVGCVSLGS